MIKFVSLNILYLTIWLSIHLKENVVPSKWPALLKEIKTTFVNKYDVITLFMCQ